MSIPKDPYLLLSYMNTKLRDEYPTLDELCMSMFLERSQIEASLLTIDYVYDTKQKHFIPKM